MYNDLSLLLNKERCCYICTAEAGVIETTLGAKEPSWAFLPPNDFTSEKLSAEEFTRSIGTTQLHISASLGSLGFCHITLCCVTVGGPL
jgi:hypothetical protein